MRCSRWSWGPLSRRRREQAATRKRFVAELRGERGAHQSLGLTQALRVVETFACNVEQRGAAYRQRGLGLTGFTERKRSYADMIRINTVRFDRRAAARLVLQHEAVTDLGEQALFKDAQRRLQCGLRRLLRRLHEAVERGLVAGK